jgi:hypothetical protein
MRMLAFLTATWCFAAASSAATIGFNGTMGGAALSITNTSTSASITSVTITIGDAAFDFDSVNLGGDATILQPDNVGGALLGRYGGHVQQLRRWGGPQLPVGHRSRQRGFGLLRREWCALQQRIRAQRRGHGRVLDRPSARV